MKKHFYFILTTVVIFSIIIISVLLPTSLAQVQSHPVSQIFPQDVNLNLTGVNITNVSYVFFGNNSVDTYLYRSGTNILQTASHFVATGGWINSTNFNASNQICIGGTCRTSWPGGLSGSGTANYIPVWTASDTLGNSSIYFSSGNIGINTTLPTSLLHINGTGSSTVVNVSNGTVHTGLFIGTLLGGQAGASIGTNTIHQFRLFTAGVDRFTVDTNGYIGINATSPSSLLHINGTGALLNVSNSSHSFLFVNSSGFVGIGTANPTTPLYVNASSLPAITIGSTGSGSFFAIDKLNTAGSITFDLQSEGGSERLEIDIGARFTLAESGNTYFQIGSSTGGSEDSHVLLASSVNRFVIYDSNAVPRFQVNATGNVGIGTILPSSLLHINGTGALLNVSNGTYSVLYVNDTGPSGFVGIGTTIPQSLFQVNSTTSNVYIHFPVNNTAVASGDCDASTEVGRSILVFNSTSSYMYVCSIEGGSTIGWRVLQTLGTG